MRGPRRNRLAVRLATLARRLDGLRVMPDIADLAREHGVCLRTIHRDLAVLEESGWWVPARVWDKAVGR